MASVATNDRKREEMAVYACKAAQLGWTTAQLAALMRCTPGTVAAWKRGASMGTNAQRETLRNLKSPAEERPRLREVAALLRKEAAHSDEWAGRALISEAFLVEANQRRRAMRLRQRADFLETI